MEQTLTTPCGMSPGKPVGISRQSSELSLSETRVSVGSKSGLLRVRGGTQGACEVENKQPRGRDDLPSFGKRRGNGSNEGAGTDREMRVTRNADSRHQSDHGHGGESKVVEAR